MTISFVVLVYNMRLAYDLSSKGLGSTDEKLFSRWSSNFEQCFSSTNSCFVDLTVQNVISF